MEAEEVNLYDVWLLLTDTVAKIDRLYMELALRQESLPVQSVTPATQWVMEFTSVLLP